jgi:hypothetical protein
MKKAIKTVTGEDGKFDLVLLEWAMMAIPFFPGQPYCKNAINGYLPYYLESQSMFRIT